MVQMVITARHTGIILYCYLSVKEKSYSSTKKILRNKLLLQFKCKSLKCVRSQYLMHINIDLNLFESVLVIQMSDISQGASCGRALIV